MTHQPSDIDQNKALLREKLKKIREQVSPAIAEAASQSIWNTLSELPEYKRSKGVCAFASIPSEINTFSILEGSLKVGKNLYLPKVNKGRSSFDYFPIVDLKNLVPGPFGILEPTHSHAAPWDELDLILVPGLAFDLKGNRLGFGKGYYDRVLANLKRSALIVGLGYSFQIVEKVPFTSDDIPMKALLTEKGFTRCSK